MDGYVKYSCAHTAAAAPAHLYLPDLDELRTHLFDAGLLGMRPDGVGFGNVSLRVADRVAEGLVEGAARPGGLFLVTATGTGGARELGPDGYCLVTGFSPKENRVCSLGPLPASSEAMTHGAVYAASAAARCVAHVHSRELFDRLLAAGAPATPENAAFGTPELARAVGALVRQCPTEGVIVTAGHDEGLVFYGPSIASVRGLVAFLLREYGTSSPEGSCGGKCGGCPGRGC